MNIIPGDIVRHKINKKIERVKEITTNSILVTATKLKPGGINCDNWFTVVNFNRMFTYYEHN